MADVFIIGDTERTPELRHEVPVGVIDPFYYAEVDGARHVLIWAFEVDRVRDSGIDAEVTPAEVLKTDELAKAGVDPYEIPLEAAVRAARYLGVESAVVPRRFPLGLADRLRAEGVELIPDQRFFDDRRRVKTTQELAGIRRAQRAAEAAAAVVRDALAAATASNGTLVLEGETVTCELLKQRAQEVLLAHDTIAEDIILSHGAQTALGHDAGSGPVATGEIVLMDIFPRDRASTCFADMTRVFVAGEPSEEIRAYHGLVKEALDLATEAVRPGVHGAEIHRLVCEFFEGHGHPTSLSRDPGDVLLDGFYHGLGHGVGLAVHEAPGLGLSGHELVVGDVITLEPGLYRNGYGGVRLEDMVLVTEDGCERLTDFPYDLDVG